MGNVWEKGRETSILWMGDWGSVILIDKGRNSSKYPASLPHSDTYMNKYSCKWRLICSDLSLEANAVTYRGMHIVVCVSVCVLTQWYLTVACQPPLSMGFPRQEYRSGLPFPSPGELPDPGIEPESPASPALAGGFFTTKPPGKPVVSYTVV